MTESLKVQLRRQLEYIQLSCKNFDEGHYAEAFRIATAIRILVHQTPRSESLLQQLGVRDSLRLISTINTEPLRPTIVMYDGLSLMPPRSPAEYVNFLQRLRREPVSVAAWWQQVVLIENDVRVERRHVVLMGAHKDGGAHVDQELTEVERKLRKGTWSSGTFGPDGQFVVHTQHTDEHVAGLRRLAFEIVNSPELLSLAGSEQTE